MPDECLWPNLYLVGAPRSGTTAVYEYLRQHPDVYMSPSKEPGFFAIDGELYDLEERHDLKEGYFITSIDAYRSLYRHRRGERVLGDATLHYLHDPKVPLRIRHYAPDAKIVAILRGPSARTYSAYMMSVRDEGTSVSFGEALRDALGSDLCLRCFAAASTPRPG